MPDWQTTMIRLRIMRDWVEANIQNGAIDPVSCGNMDDWLDDAMTLLEKQKPVEPTFDKHPGSERRRALCGVCGKGLTIGEDTRHGDNYCPCCGVAVKWPLDARPERFKRQHDIARSFAGRNERIREDRRAGMTLAELEEKYCLSKARVQQICAEVEKNA